MGRLRRTPGVTTVGSAQGMPFSGWQVQGQLVIEGAPRAERGQELISHYQVVSTDYFKAIGVPLVAGRWLTPEDRDTMASNVLVNETLVKRFFAGANPIGKRVSVSGDPLATIVGVIKDFRHYRLPEPMGP